MLGFSFPFWLGGQQLGIGVEGLFINGESQQSAGSVVADTCLLPGNGVGWLGLGILLGREGSMWVSWVLILWRFWQMVYCTPFLVILDILPLNLLLKSINKTNTATTQLNW